ncbi:MAG: metallophosphoesterase [Acidiferrobacteraceae bacterium]
MLSLFIFLYSLLHVYVYARIDSALPLGPLGTFALWAGFSAMILMPLIARKVERQGHEHLARVLAWLGYLWMGSIFIFAAVLLLTDTSWRLLPAMVTHAVSRLLGMQAPFFLSAAVTSMLVPYAFIERSLVRVERLTLFTERVAGGANGLRIAHVSDVHIGLMSGRRRVRRLARLLNRCAPDMVVSTGDLLDTHLKDHEEIARELSALKPPLGKFAVLGNHECYAGLETSVQFIEQSGFVLLRNRMVRAGGITIAGVDDPAAGATPDSERRLMERAVPGFTLLLKHRPEMLPGTARRVDLQLSGHTHRGQIFPFNLLTRLRYRTHAGLFRIGDAYLYVSRGTGSWGPPLRLFAPPEITMIELRLPQSAEQAEALARPC